MARKTKKIVSVNEMAKCSAVGFGCVLCSVLVLTAQIGVYWVTEDNSVPKTNKYTVIQNEPDMSEIKFLSYNNELEEYKFNNVLENTTTKCISNEGDFKLSTEVFREEKTTSLKKLKSWVSDTVAMTELFCEEPETLGLQIMTFKNDNTYTAIVKSNGKISSTFVPFIDIYQVAEIEEDVYKVTTCTNGGMSAYDKAGSEAVLEEVCLALDLNYSAGDLLLIMDVQDESNSIFGVDANLSNGFTEAKFFGFDEKSGTITEYKGDLPNAPTTVIIPSSIGGVEVTAIGDEAFYKYASASKVTSVVIPDSVTSIGEKAFLANNLLQSVTMPKNLKYIGEKCFQDCSSLRKITLTGTVGSIPNSAFKNCTSLESIDLCGTETIIGKSAFENCRILKAVNHRSNIKTIDSKAFLNTKIDAFEADVVEANAFDE